MKTACLLRQWVFLFSILLGAFVLLGGFTAEALFAQATSDDVSARRAQLESELETLEAEIRVQAVLLNSKRSERVSIERDVAILNAEIKKAQLSIRARGIEIQNLGGQIGVKRDAIVGLDAKLVRERESLAQLLRKTNQVDDFSLVEVVLSNRQISDFFEDLDTFNVIKAELQLSFVEIAVTKDDTEVEKSSLENKQAAEVELRNIQELEKRKIERAEEQRRRILNITKGQEATYQSIIATKERTAAQIRAELFALRGSAAIPYAKALEFANAASKATGVSPAFILGVIEQESKLGENIGQCNLPEDPPKYKWQNIMKSPRDTEPYLLITSKLGLDPNMMPLSCAPSYGYGGAMGPAQFIPSTWILYEDRIAAVSGQNPPNPWEASTAFFASALLLMDNGADRGTRASERLAALRYFAGWKNAEKSAYAFYGDGVMELRDKNQRLIDILGGS